MQRNAKSPQAPHAGVRHRYLSSLPMLAVREVPRSVSVLPRSSSVLPRSSGEVPRSDPKVPRSVSVLPRFAAMLGFAFSLRDGGVYPGRAGWLLLSAFCRGTRFRVSSFDRAIYPPRREVPRHPLSRSSFYGGVYPGRRRARPSALRLGLHGLPALQTQRQVPPAPQTAAEPAFAFPHLTGLFTPVAPPKSSQT